MSWWAIAGPAPLEDLATRDDVDLVLVATGGVVSLRPLVAALIAGKVVATANKETLVAGGHLVMPLARELASRTGANPPAWLRPIDSEHSAIWQCLAGERRDDIRRLILTASRRSVQDVAGRPTRVGDPGATLWPTRRGAWAPRSRSTRPRS